MTYQCLRTGTPDVMKRLDKGEDVDPTSYYFRMNPRVRDQLQEIRLDEPHHRRRYWPQAP